VMWPSLGLAVERQLRDDPKACLANFHAFNRWLNDEWGFAYRDRIFAAPWLSLVDLEGAVTELESVLDLGARIVGVLFAPVAGKSLGSPYFDPIWSRLAEARVPVAFHGAESGYNQMLSVHWGEQPRPAAHRQSPFQRAMFFGDRPIMDTLADLILHNVFGRHPHLQAISVENGSVWVDPLLRAMEHGVRTGQYGEWIGGRFTESPTELFRQHVSVAPYDDDDIRGLIELIGANRVLLGSDYPHPEGHPDPAHFLDRAGLDEDVIHLISRDNGAALLKLGR